MVRRPAAALLIAIAAVLLVAGLALRHLHAVTRPDAFAEHAASLAERPEVRRALADAAVDAVGDAVAGISPAAAPAARRIVAPRADRVVASDAFRRAFRGTARRGLRQVVDGDRRRVVFTVADVADLTTETTGPLPTALDRLLREAGAVPIFSFDRSRTTAERTARVERLSTAGVPLLVGAAVLLLLAVALARERRPAVRGVGVALAVAGLVIVAAERLARTATIGAAAPGQDRDVAAAVWDELLRDLRVEALVLAGVGLLVALAAAALGGRRAPGRPAYPLG